MLTIGDAFVVGFGIVAGGWLVWKLIHERANRVDAVVLTSLPGLIIAGTLFAALGIAMFVYGAKAVIFEPTETLHSRRWGDVHFWALGGFGIEAGLVVLVPATLLWRKALRIRRDGRDLPAREGRASTTAPPLPTTAIALARALDPARARREASAALDAIAPGTATADQLMAIVRRLCAASATATTEELLALLARHGFDADRWRPVLEDLDALRFGGGGDPRETERRVRELLPGSDHGASHTARY